MGRGRYLPRIVSEGYRGKIGEPKPPANLAGLRIPGARYREIRPPQSKKDPLLEADTCFPRPPDRYEDEQHYEIHDRWPYLLPAKYREYEPEWQYEEGPEETMFDGRALNTFDRQPHLRIPSYEDGLFAPGESEELLRQAAEELRASAAEAGQSTEAFTVPDDLSADDNFAMDSAALLDVPGWEEPAAMVDVPVEARLTALDDVGSGDLERILVEHDASEEPCADSLWPTPTVPLAHDELALAEHAFDQQLEDLARDFRQQEQTFTEPDFGPDTLLPDFDPPGPPEPPDLFPAPANPPGFGPP